MRRLPVGGPAVLVLALALMTATACGATPGTPTTETPAGTSAGSAAGSATAAPPTRPREVRLDGEDPCALLTAGQLAEFGIAGAGKPIPVKVYETTGCSWTATGAGYRLIPVPTEGIEAWTGGERAAKPTETGPVLGFPAITVTVPSDTASCDVMVDMAEGQYLVASFTGAGAGDQGTEPCDGARRLAEAAVHNLLG